MPLPPDVLTNGTRPSASSSPRMCTAASTISRQPMPSPGSRSKTMRSGLSSRLRSAAPGVELDDAELRQRQIALGVLDREVGLRLALGVGRLEGRDRGRHAGEGMALEEAVLRPAGRAAHQRDRPAENVRQHEIADEGVVDRDVELGRPGFAEQPPRRVGHPDRRQVGLGDQALALRRHRRRQLDVAQALEHGMAQRIVGGAVGIVDMRRQHRPHPDHLLRRAVELGCAGLAAARSRASSARSRAGVEAGADLAAILQLAVFPFAERQRGQPFGGIGDRCSRRSRSRRPAAPWSWSRSS